MKRYLMPSIDLKPIEDCDVIRMSAHDILVGNEEFGQATFDDIFPNGG